MVRAMNGALRVTGAGVALPLLAGAVAGVLAGVVAGCSGGNGTTAATGGPGVVATVSAKTVPYNLYTHCGIYEAKVQGRWYLATPPLSDGNGNPPSGWGNPDQHGTMTLVSAAEVVFTDQAGHRVVFRAAPATGKYPSQICS
jgi:hypothetical protein